MVISDPHTDFVRKGLKASCTVRGGLLSLGSYFKSRARLTGGSSGRKSLRAAESSCDALLALIREPALRVN